MSSPASMIERARWAASSTWQAIASDYLAGTAACGDDPNEITLDEIGEVVMDADRIDTFGDDSEAAEWLRSEIREGRMTYKDVGRMAEGSR